MKQLKDLINQDDPRSSIGFTPSTSSESRREELKRGRLMDRLWERLQEIYGHQLNSQYGETIPESWERLLTEVSPEQIKNGLNNLSSRSDSWPPNAVEFRQLCLPTTISPDGTNSGAYLYIDDPKHPLARDKARMALQSDEQISKKRKAGRSALDGMKDLF